MNMLMPQPAVGACGFIVRPKTPAAQACSTSPHGLRTLSNFRVTVMAEAEQLDRRTTNTAMLELIRTIQQDVTEMRLELNNHIQTEPKEWATVLSALMNKSFPNGDPDGHRRDHEIRMKLAEQKAEFWAKMAYEIKKWGLIGFSLWAVKTLLESAAVWIQNGAHIK